MKLTKCLKMGWGRRKLADLLAVVISVVGSIAAEADVVARWTFDDYPVGTVLEPGAVFRNKENPGTYDLVLCAVDPSQAAVEYRPVVTNGFPAYLQWEPSKAASNQFLRASGNGIWFKGGAAKGYYLKLADPEGALKTQNWTLEAFVRSVGKKCPGAVISMPAQTDGTMRGTNSVCYSAPLATWPGTYFLKVVDAAAGTYTYGSAGWNATSRGDLRKDIWFQLAVQCSNGTLSYKRDVQNMYSSTTWVQPDSSAPFLFGGTLWSGDYEGCLTEARFSDTALSFPNMAHATVENAPHGTTLLHARYEPGQGYHFTGVLADYVNEDSTSNQSTHNATSVLLTNDVQAVFVHPGRALPPTLEKNVSSLVPTNGLYFCENRSAPFIDLQNGTIECFVRIDEVTGTETTLSIVHFGLYAGNDGTPLWGLVVRPNGRLSAAWVPYNLNNTEQYWASSLSTPESAKIDDGKWHHIALVVIVDYETANTTIKLYLDHNFVSSSSYPGTLRVNAGAENRRCLMIRKGNGWRGALDELRISAGALDPETEMLWQFDHGGTLLYFR